MKSHLSSEELSRRARQAVARPSFIQIINRHIRSCVLLLAAQVVSDCCLFVHGCPTSLFWSLGTNDPPRKDLRAKISASFKSGSMGQDSGKPPDILFPVSGNRWVLVSWAAVLMAVASLQDTSGTNLGILALLSTLYGGDVGRKLSVLDHDFLEGK
ncbi:hypothetical protein BDY19DRAFT_85678 [Irpex rosettiformis]|uniref:Uncharacterized protein n=1 Tax=Irpex rosettiformis TaxID=378272 RepID=A0ACB8U621_9APHY|nr:hypothetical protein BDY19DRAFT_85678 [Irpex rosettiformis]